MVPFSKVMENVVQFSKVMENVVPFSKVMENVVPFSRVMENVFLLANPANLQIKVICNATRIQKNRL